ncbi:hypothetical protein LEMA_P023580.1 [Plenodomus lingam JN3]|uniref:Uncharacterized protein n=1 Tax=Leptosphaeria maculans (strain JN3 / isolate v23.1.3 / race Av1-4-5-6-7-8) TaxID=985895 RepID=E4ZWZ6_LEPMJ|nr:hypothetical protein LEMA_P023580.1 [Plenodomus lingam JN3]CBX95206.1 hypothetical protein LEMA_P023580.1 [Plenodomus lingam JN3]
MSFSSANSLASQQATSHRGLARVSLDSLHFEHPLVLEKHRNESLDNVQRLEKIFERSGCLRLHDENILNAVVREDDLATALSRSNLTAAALRRIISATDAPALHLEKVSCLTGLHRIRAADRFLDPNDKWWTVRLFSNDTPQPVLCHIIESYANEQKPRDGDIFRKIRYYHREKDAEAENRWWARLDKSKPKDLRQLLKRHKLASAFDALIDFPGLWAKIQLGALHRLLTLKCDEEMIRYLNHVALTWTTILKYESTTMSPSIVDAVTVNHLELLAPNHSKIDRDLLLDLMDRQILFPSVIDNQQRRALASNLCATIGLIPSLWTFFEVLKYLEPMCEILKDLIGGKQKRTIHSSLMANYYPPATPMVQISDTTEAEITIPLSKAEAAKVSYIELWAFCGRHFDGLTAFTPRKEINGTKPLVKGPNSVLWHHLAKFAVSRGFKTKRAQELAATDPYTQLAREYLYKANPICASPKDSQVRRVVHASYPEVNIRGPETLPEALHITKERRSGRTFESDLEYDKKLLFLPHVYGSDNPEEASLRLSRRYLFSTLFGNFQLQHEMLGTHKASAFLNLGAELMELDTTIDCGPEAGAYTDSDDEMSQTVASQEHYQKMLLEKEEQVRELERQIEVTEYEKSNLLSERDALYAEQQKNAAISQQITDLQRRRSVLEGEVNQVRAENLRINQQAVEIRNKASDLQRMLQLEGANSSRELEVLKLRERSTGSQASNVAQTKGRRKAIKGHENPFKIIKKKDEDLKAIKEKEEAVSSALVLKEPTYEDKIQTALSGGGAQEIWKGRLPVNNPVCFVIDSVDQQVGRFIGTDARRATIEGKFLPDVSSYLQTGFWGPKTMLLSTEQPAEDPASAVGITNTMMVPWEEIDSSESEMGLDMEDEINNAGMRDIGA